MNQRAIEKTELNKILALAADYAVTEGAREKLTYMQPVSNLFEVKNQLKKTEEGIALLFSHGIAKIEYFPVFLDEIER